MNVLEVKEVSKKYPGFHLKNVSFCMSEGKIMGLIGKNGAGKSTTLKAILNMVSMDSGEIRMLDKDFKENEELCKQNIGVVLGGIDFYKYKKVNEITSITKSFYNNWSDQDYNRYMTMFQIDDKKRVNQLSQGMKVKYLIAIALSHNAKLLILDEPTSGLDPVAREDLLDLFIELVKAGSRSILFSTHITSDLEKCADDITYIKDGEIRLSASKEDFLNGFEHLRKDEEKELTLEEIMIRNEKVDYNV